MEYYRVIKIRKFFVLIRKGLRTILLSEFKKKTRKQNSMQSMLPFSVKISRERIWRYFLVIAQDISERIVRNK